MATASQCVRARRVRSMEIGRTGNARVGSPWPTGAETMAVDHLDSIGIGLQPAEALLFLEMRYRAIRSCDRVLAIDSNAGANWLAAVTL
jgi:hypothetical protein